MTERLAFARDALDRAEGAWDESRLDGLLVRTHETLHRRRRQRAIAWSVAAVLVLGAGLATWLGARQGTVLELGGDPLQALDGAPAGSAAGWTMELGRSRVAVLRDGTDLRTLPDEDGRATLELLAGSIRADAFELRVRVLGQTLVAERAAFELAIVEPGFELRVEAGAVVLGERVLVAGDRLLFDASGRELAVRGADARPADVPRAAAERDGAASPGVAADVERGTDARARGGKPRAANKPRWRALVQTRDWAEAYTEMKRADPKTVRASVDALMAAADAARFGGHPDEAPSYLAEVLEQHRKHAMAPLAAFTLGRVYLEQLGAAGKAARAFAEARALAPAGALADDALAREVEAWAKAGDRAKARERAHEYLAAYPEGRRIDAVRRHADLPAP